ncbi:MAG: hypothetical protein RI967_417, partial [Planctomycetota bacterium]
MRALSIHAFSMSPLSWTVALAVVTMPTAARAESGLHASDSPPPEVALAREDPSPLAPASPLDARALGVGSYVPDVDGTALDGVERGWRSGRGEKLTVIALTSATCPLCRKFGPSLARIERAFRNRGVNFVFVNVSGTDTTDEMRRQASDMGWSGVYLDDRASGSTSAIASALRARTTTEVFVVDAGNTLVYRGAVSDQYGVNFTREAPRAKYLEDALDALLAGGSPEITATSSPGCAIEYEERRAGATRAADPVDPADPVVTLDPPTVTYAREISRILAANCVECHREGGVGPFRLDSYEAASRRAS